MTLLALDLGTHTGVARGRPGEMPLLQTWEMPSRGGPDVGPFMAAFAALLRHELRGVSLLAFEAPYVGAQMLKNLHAARRGLGLPALCEMIAHEQGVRCVEAKIMTLKKNFAGHGRAEKWEMIRAARQRGFTPDDDHQADAAAVWWWCVCCEWPEFSVRYDPTFRRA